MNSLKRKQFLLPQNLILAVQKAYKAKTETEAVLLSLEQALRKKKLEELSELPGKFQFDMSQKDLRALRGK